MGGDNISLIASKLIDAGKSADTPVALVSNVSLPTQREIFSTLGELRYARYRTTPVLVLVGEVVNLEKHSHCPSVYYTGTQSTTPFIRIEKNEVEQPDARDFDWVIFTSRYGVRYYDKPLHEAKVASVGPVTSHELKTRGVFPDFESPTESAEGLIDFFCTQPQARILLPRSDKGLKVLSDALVEAGHSVTDLPVYRNIPEPYPVIQNLQDYDKVVFTSPSTVEAFKAIYKAEDSKHLLLVAKGKTTYEAIQTI